MILNDINISGDSRKNHTFIMFAESTDLVLLPHSHSHVMISDGLPRQGPSHL